MILLGITGPIGSGKTSFADALHVAEPSAQHLEAGLIVTEVVNALNKKLAVVPAVRDLTAVNQWLAHLPGIILETTGNAVSKKTFLITQESIAAEPGQYTRLWEYLEKLRQNPELAQHEITPAHKEVYRPILQWVGGFCVTHVTQTIWFDEIIRRAREAANQGAVVCVAGGVRFPAEAEAIYSAGGHVIQMVRPQALEHEISDVTERERLGVVYDSTVLNDGTLAELQNKAERLLQDILSGKLQPTY